MNLQFQPTFTVEYKTNSWKCSGVKISTASAQLHLEAALNTITPWYTRKHQKGAVSDIVVKWDICLVFKNMLLVISKCLDFHLGHCVTHFCEYLLMFYICCNNMSWECYNVSQKNEKPRWLNFSFELDWIE